MGITVKGQKAARDNLAKFISDVQGRKAVRAITKALIIIGTESATMVPVATSMLINSQYREIDTKGTRITGKVGYSANYAMYVHNAPGKYLGAKKLRPVAKGSAKGSMGYIWDKSGEPQFLEKAVDKTEAQVSAVIVDEMKV